MDAPPSFGEVPALLWKVAIFCGIIVFIKVYFKGSPTYSRAVIGGKTAIVTGANQGIGKEIARELADRNGRIILACRDKMEGKAAAEEIKKQTKNKDIFFKYLDLSSFDSVHKFSEEIHKEEDKIDILINNAAVMMNPELTRTTDGFEEQWQVNYLGAFLLTHLLVDLLKAGSGGRIVNVSCRAHGAGKIDFDNLSAEQEYIPREAYTQSKLALILFTRELAKKLEGTNAVTNSCHPGVCNTNLLRHMPLQSSSFLSYTTFPFIWLLMKTAKDGMNTPVTCAIADEIAGISGKYFSDCVEKEPADQAKDDEVAKKLWDISMKMVGLGKSE